MINLTELETILITCMPAIVSVITSLSSVITFLKSLKKLKDNEELKAERDALVEQNKVLLTEMKKQQKLVKLLIQKTCKVHYEDLSEVKNDKELQD